MFIVRVLRRALDALYLLSGILAALALISIVTLQITLSAGRMLGFSVRGGTDYAGYAMAAATFLGLAYAFQHGAHIRVSLLLTALGKRRFWGEVWCYGFACVLTVYFAWQAVEFTHQTWRFHDVSPGLDATPLWIPQVAMAFGTVVFAICMIDNFVTLLATGRSHLSDEDAEIAAAAEAAAAAGVEK